MCRAIEIAEDHTVSNGLYAMVMEEDWRRILDRCEGLMNRLRGQNG